MISVPGRKATPANGSRLAIAFSNRTHDTPTVKPMNWLLLGWALCGTAFAGDWTLSRFEGRDYVPLGEIAKFYAFPAPPPVAHDLVVAPVTLTPTPAPAPTPAAKVLAQAVAESEAVGNSVEPV